MPTGQGTIGGYGHHPIRLRDIEDGTSDTIIIAEACGTRIIWTQPVDVEVNERSLGINLPGPEKGLSRGAISSPHHRGAHVLFADGNVKFINANIDPQVLKALLTIDGGEKLEDPFGK